MDIKKIKDYSTKIIIFSIIFIILQFFLSIIIYLILINNVNNKRYEEFKKTFDNYLLQEFKILEENVYGFAHWEKLSSYLRNNKVLTSKLYNEWAAFNINKNDLSAIIIDNKIIAAGGLYYEEIKNLLTNNIIYKIYEKTSMKFNSHTNRYLLNYDNKTILIISSPLCNDEGKPISEGIMLFAKVLDKRSDLVSSFLRSKIYFNKPNKFITFFKLYLIDSFNPDNKRILYIKPHFNINFYIIHTIVITLLIQIIVITFIILSYRFLFNFLNKLYENISNNYKKMEEELYLASGLQKSLINDIYSIKNIFNYFNLSIKYVPYEYVSGDLYDAVSNINGDWLIILDIMGNGVSAALIGNFILTTFRDECNFSKNPFELFIRMSYKITRHLPPEIYVAGICLNIKDDIITICSAGGEDIIYYNNNEKKINKIRLAGPFLGFTGVMAKQKWNEYKIKLNNSDKLILYTDGVINTMILNKNLNSKSFFTVIEKYINESPEIFTNNVYEECLSLCNGKILDDLILLCIEKI